MTNRSLVLMPSAYAPHVGGVEEVARQTAKILTQRGWRVTIVVDRWPRDLPVFETIDGVPVHRLALRVPDGGLRGQLSHFVSGRAARREFLTLLQHVDADLVHAHCVSFNGHYARLAKRNLGLPIVVSAHGELSMDAGQSFTRSEFMRQTLRGLLSEADALSAPSQFVAGELRAWSGRNLDIEIVPNGIDPNEFDGVLPRPHPRPYVAALGRFVPQKGFDILINAFAQANLDGWDLLLAGDGPERQSLEARAGANVHFLGRASRKEVAALLTGAQIFALPSRLEPLGIVNLEAMICGKPVIASRVGGVPEVVTDGETGLLVPPENVDALAAALRCLAGDAALRQKLGDAGRRRAQTLTWDAAAADYERFYHKVLSL